MNDSLTFKDIINAEVPAHYENLPLLDIIFKEINESELEQLHEHNYPLPNILLAFKDDGYCIVCTDDCGYIPGKAVIGKDLAKIYVSAFSKPYYGSIYAGMEKIGLILREYLECKAIHACTYPTEEYWEKIDFYTTGFNGHQIIGRITLDVKKGYDYFIYNTFDNSARLINLTDAQYMKLVYLRMVAQGIKRTMIEHYGKIGALMKDALFHPSDDDFCFISDNTKEMSYCMIAINQNGKWGFIDANNRMIVPPCYDYATNGACRYEVEMENIACARVVVNGKVGLVNSEGKQFVECIYDTIGDQKTGLIYRNGMALVSQNFKYGFIDKNGHLAVKCIYDLVDPHFDESDTYFNDAGVAILEFDGTYVFIDKSGNVVRSTSKNAKKSESKFLYPWEGDVIRARVGKKWGLINQRGEWITPLMFDRIYTFWHSNRAQAMINGKYGVLDSEGQWIVHPEYDSLYIYSEYIGAVKDSTTLYFNLDGEEISGPISTLDEKQDFSEGLVRTEFNGRWGFKDSSGKWMIAPLYEEACDFFAGWARVTLNGANTSINKLGELYQREGLAVACSYMEDTYSAFGFVDETFKWIIKPSFQMVGYFFEGLAKAKVKGKWGFIDHNGKWAVGPKYEDVGNFHDGIAPVILNDNCHWINQRGELIK